MPTACVKYEYKLTSSKEYGEDGKYAWLRSCDAFHRFFCTATPDLHHILRFRL